MQAERIKTTLAFAYVATGVAQLAELGYNYLLYSAFPVEEIGLFAWASALVVFFNMAIDLGVEPILTRRFGRQPVKFSSALAAVYFPRLPIIVLAALTVTAIFGSGLLDDDRYWLLILVGGQSVFNVSDSACRAWLRAHHRQTIANFVAAGIGLLKLSAILLLTRESDATIVELLMAILVIRLVVSVVLNRTVRRLEAQLETRPAEPVISLGRELIGAGVIVGGIGVLTAVQNRFDWLLVSYFVSTDALASYSLANKLYEISQVIVGASLTTVFPWLCRSSARSQRLSILLSVIVASGALMACIGTIAAPPLIELLFGDKYAGIDTAARLLMFAVGFMATCGILYQIALAAGFERSLLRVTAIATILQAGCNLLLVPRFGINGAAVGMLVLVTCTAAGMSVAIVKVDAVDRAFVLRVALFLAAYTVWTASALLLMPSTLASVAASCVVLPLLAGLLLFDSVDRRVLHNTVLAALSPPGKS